ncbi:CG42296 [Drosophila busckii]|uniref:CG42296 n=1 Tax=Drosophila busckii TaxID=30019 RepID=A0A0M4EDT8_DROBS|nr:CG42296 [Drosophila busckii]
MNPGDIEHNAYYAPPILQPVILAPHSNPYQQQYYAMQGYEPAPAHYGHHHKNSASYHNSNKKQPSTTIIHNNVIPVHLSSTSSGEKEMLDAYGNSLGHFPNLDKHALSSNNNNIDNNNYYNKFIATMTTARPSIAVTTMSSQFGAPAPAYGGEFTLTTPRPFEQQPSPATVANFYTASPHLNEQNVNQVYQSDSYPTGYPMTVNIQRPMNSGSAGLFPAQLEPGQVKIRPNAEKIESMEMDTDENNSNNNRHNLLTYSSSSSNLHGMSQQLAPEPYVEQQITAQFMVRPTPSVSSSIYSDAAGNVGLSMFSSTGSAGPNLKLKRPPGASAGFGQLVNFNGNFISLDVFQKSIMPLLTQSPAALSQLSNVEVISCQAGVRQANQTDCTRYFVCSKKDGNVLSYACPPYTGFNQQTRICDAQTYAQCGNVPSFAGYSIDENRRLQLETLKMLSEAKRRQEAALKAQSISNLLQQYGQSPSAASPMSAEQNMLDSYMVSFPEPQIIISTPRPTPATPTLTPISHSGSGSVKKRKYYCKEGDKIPDQTSIASYFVCYKNAQGQMKGHKMTCSKGLVFCPSTLLCTLASKCNS